MRPALVLSMVIAVSALLLGLLYDATREPIRLQQIAREAEMVALLLPGTAQLTETDIPDHPVSKVVRGYNEAGQLLGFALTASAPGYAGPVEIIVGFDAEGVLTGVQILNHRETPGLGTAIQGEIFLQQFEGRTQPMSVSRNPTGDNEIAALASATISTAAVVSGINAAIEFMQSEGN